MTQVKQGSLLLKELQDKIGKQLDERESAIKNYSPSPIKCSSSKTDIRKKHTAEDLLLMEEYSRGVYQGD